MPHYDYTCGECGHTLEALQSIKAEPLKTCPKCNKEALNRGIGGGGALFRFKGSGFYLTDYCNPTEGEKMSTASKGCGCKGSQSCD